MQFYTMPLKILRGSPGSTAIKILNIPTNEYSTAFKHARKKPTERKILIGLNMKTKRLLILKEVFFWNLLSRMTIKRNLLRKQRTTELW